jgi:hypothetical protein
VVATTRTAAGALGVVRTARATEATRTTRTAPACKATRTTGTAGAPWTAAAAVASAATAARSRRRAPWTVRPARRIAGSAGNGALGSGRAVRSTAAWPAGSGGPNWARRTWPGEVGLGARTWPTTGLRARRQAGASARQRARAGTRVERAGVLDRSSSHSEARRLPGPDRAGHVTPGTRRLGPQRIGTSSWLTVVSTAGEPTC